MPRKGSKRYFSPGLPSSSPVIAELERDARERGFTINEVIVNWLVEYYHLRNAYQQQGGEAQAFYPSIANALKRGIEPVEVERVPRSEEALEERQQKENADLLIDKFL